MDKLQPLITHRFWIATGLAVVLGLVGYWMGTSALAEETDQLTAQVKALSPSPGAAQPNDTWVEQAKEIAEARKATLAEVAAELAGTQEGLRVWPEGYRRYVDGLEYFGRIGQPGREAYIDFYPNEVDSVREVVRPYEDESREGVVAMRPGVVPSFSTADWRTLAPQSNTIWAAQEDVWLLRELLARASEINEPYDSILDAPLKEIQSLVLQGGGGEAEVAGTAGERGNAGGFSEGSSSTGGGRGPDVGPGGRGGAGGAGEGVLEFDLAEEVGAAGGLDDDPTLAPDGAADAATATGGSSASSGDSYNAGRGSDGGMFGSPGGPTGGGGQGETPGAVTPGGGRRYIASAPELPYRTRAFQMTVVVDHRELPALLMSLTNAAWPVEVVRVHSDNVVTPAGHAAAAGRATGRGAFGGGFSSGDRGPDGGYGGRPGGGLGGRLGGGLGGRRDGFGGDDRGSDGSGFGDSGRRGGGRTRSTAPPPDPSDPYQVALADPYLVTAFVGGIMTIYKPLKDEDAAADSAAAGVTPTNADAPPADDVDSVVSGTEDLVDENLNLGLDEPAASEDGGPVPMVGTEADRGDAAAGAATAGGDVPAASAGSVDDPTALDDLPL